MSPVEWTNGGLAGLQAYLEGRVEALKEEALELMEETVIEGAESQIEALEAAATRTGIERVDSGRGDSAGRHESGAMIEGITTSVEIEDDSPGNYVVAGRYGWADPENYYLEQDGIVPSDTIPAAHSLVSAHIQTRESFRAKVEDLASGKRG